MASLLGFRPPHFSEEAAWLPPWLQPSSIREESNQAFQCPSGQGLEEMQCLQQRNNDIERGKFLDDDRCKSFHLFLSGQDNSTMDFPSCSSNHEAHYRLRLSLSEEIENSLNPTLSEPQAERFEFHEVLPVQQPPAKVILDEDIHEQRDNLGLSGHEPLSFKEQNGIEPKVDAKSHIVDINDAVELAVAASEALTILEVVQNESSTDLSTSSVVLEAAMRVKQARLDDLKDTLDSSIEESNEIDFLLDFDEATMANAYEDVGLTVTSHGDLNAYESISHVKDSYASESSMPTVKRKCNEAVGLEADSGYVSPQQQKHVNDANALLKSGLLLNSFEGGTRKEQIDYAELGTDNADLASDTDPKLSCSVEQAIICTAEVGWQRKGFAIGELTSSHKILRSSLRSMNPINDEREDKMMNLVPDRFQSRWFGGWTMKHEASIPAVTDGKYKRSIPDLFADETSSLSESVDIASDKNSCMQKQQDVCNIASQLSIAPGGTYENEKVGNNENLLSEDVGISPNLSATDPLCSVVPCSFTTDSACHHVVVSQNCKLQVNVEKHSDPVAEDNLKRVSPQNTEIPRGEGGCNSKINGESSPIIRRQVASLKAYSMLYPRSDLYLEKGCTRDESLPIEHAPNILDFRDDNDSHNQTAKGGTDLQSHMERETNLPIPISDGNSSRCLSPDVGGKENPEQTVVPESNVKLLPTALSRKVESNCKNYLVPRRKRVRFSEVEISYPHVKKFRKSKSRAHEVQRQHATNKKMLLQDLKFLLTGFSVKKHKQIRSVIEKNGGIVLDDIPSPSTSNKRAKYKCQILPLILCPGRLLTTKFLYGCAVNACILRVKWLFDSIGKGSILPCNKYIILKEHASESCKMIGKPVRRTYFIFDNIAIMLHGKPDFCSKMAKIIKHGGGLVFKTFHWLVRSRDSKKVSDGAIVVEDENSVSRQLKQCALEQKIRMIPFNWIINSLYAGRLLPAPEDKHSSLSMSSKPQEHPVHEDMSEEI